MKYQPLNTYTTSKALISNTHFFYKTPHFHQDVF